MKKSIFVLVAFIIVHFTFIIEDCTCQWEPDVRLTNNPSPSTTNGSNQSVAAIGDFIHVVWMDYRDGNFEIYYKRSTNGGTNWGADVRLTNDAVNSWYPRVSVSGTVVHVVWEVGSYANSDIYYKRSTDGGLNWGTDIQLNDTNTSSTPFVSASGSNVYVVWQDTRDGNGEIYYNRSTDGGANWGTDIRLTNNPSSSGTPTVAVSGSVVHVVWDDNRDGNLEIYYKRSTDGGANWGADTRLTNYSGISVRAVVSVSGSTVHIIFEDYRSRAGEIYYKRSTDQGVNWGADTRLTNDPASSQLPHITVSGSNIHAVWNDNRNSVYDIYYKCSTDGGTNWEADVRLTYTTEISEAPSTAASGSAVHVVWTDFRDGLGEIYYKRNPNGNPTKIVNISSEIPERFALEQNYPNPFNQCTMFNVQCAIKGHVTLKVYDITGKEVTVLVNEYLQPGKYEVRFEAGNLPSGMYFYQLKTEFFTETKKFILLK